MSYIDQENGSRRVAIGGVVLLHIVVGYALISGFAITVIRGISPPIEVREYPEDKVPPPTDNPPPQPQPRQAHPDPVIDKTIDIGIVGDGPTLTDDGVKVVYPPFKQTEPPLPPPLVSHARDAIAGPSRATWVTNDDYPTAALRDEVQGVVGIEVTIGTDGRVTACSVTNSSGNDLLDQTTCRVYARRARFQSALDDGGKPTIGHHADRIRWQIPQ